jgi:NarL family two-component system response regulator LiaR
MTEELIKVIIVDDHLLVRDGLNLLLSTFDDINVIAVADGGEKALALCRQEQPDVILMDMVMPEQDGPIVIERILKNYPEIKVIALTSFVEEDLVARAIQSGAIGYLLKSVSADKLAEAIRSAYQGQSTIEAEAAKMLLHAFHKPAQLGDDLTERERQVLTLLVDGMTNKEIAEQLNLSHGTIRVYVSKILSKLSVTNRTEAATLALQNNLIPEKKG